MLGDAIKQTVVSFHTNQDRQRHAGLHNDVDAAFHELIDIAVEWSEDALNVFLAEFFKANRNHHQHDARGSDPIEFVSCVVDDRQWLERSDLHLGKELFEHFSLSLE